MLIKYATLIVLALVGWALTKAEAVTQDASFFVNRKTAKVEGATSRSTTEGKAIYPIMVRVPQKGFEIGKYEVTQKQWQHVMGDNPSYFAGCGENCPVEMVGWDKVQGFLAKLNKETGRNYRLPTENEWEYACKGGRATTFCGSDDIEAVGWYAKNSGLRTHPVGQKQPNGYGLYDMTGNVWEWVQAPTERNVRVLRGGSWGEFPLAFRVGARMRIGERASVEGANMGFRLARTLP